MSDLRPTLFLAQLSNLLAGNISIVHGVTGSSRTFMGEESAGVDAVRVALARIAAGQSDIALVGGSLQRRAAGPADALRVRGRNLKDRFAPVWERGNGGVALGSLGAFLVIEARSHAEARGAKPLARLSAVYSDRSKRTPGGVTACARASCGTRSRTGSTRSCRGALRRQRRGARHRRRTGFPGGASRPCRARHRHLSRTWAEPQFVMNVALAAIALDHGSLFPPCDSTGLEKPMSGDLQPGRGDRGRALAWRRPGVGRTGRLREASDGRRKDKQGRPTVVVTGRGVVTSLGAGKTDNWAKLTAGESGIRAITRFPTDGLRTRIAGTVDFLPPPIDGGADRTFAELAAEEAIAKPASARAAIFPGRCSWRCRRSRSNGRSGSKLAAKSGANDKVTYDDIAAGEPAFSRLSPDRFLIGSVADYLAEKFGTKGSPISLSTACASGATAIQLGVEAIRRGETDAALCIGTDGSISPEALIRFSLLSALSTSNDVPQGAAKPFSKNRDGFVMAEGAGALVLESYEAAKARGATILGVLEGCGEMADAFHRTRSSPDGKPIIGCIANAIKDAGLTPDDIDYVNAHGTSTPENDKMEYLGCGRVRRAHEERADLLQQIHDRPHAVGGRRDRGGVLAADARSTSASRPPSITTCRIRRSRSTWCRTRRATPRRGTPFPIPSVSAGRTSRW